MPFGSEGPQPGIALALSGGGFRAALFHLGALWRLNELGVLRKLDRLSSVSGGSITAGWLALSWTGLQWAEGVAANFRARVVDPLRAFCARDIDVPAIGEGALLPWKRASDVVREAYEEHLFGKVTLRDLPDHPRFVFNATNFASGVSFRFSKPYAGDYRIGLIRTPAFRLSEAVAASSAFPPFLSPVRLEPGADAFERTDGADLYPDRAYRETLLLTDGGVYDNLGLETVWNRYLTILASDAGAPFGLVPEPGSAWHTQALRAMDIATNQARALRKRALIDDFARNVRKGAYWGIGSRVSEYGLPDTLPVPDAATACLASMRTRLNCFSEGEQGRLINGGYALCDAALRRYVLPGAALPPPQWPCPLYALDQPIPAERGQPVEPMPPSHQ
jgi:NTE family protein